MWVRLCPLGVDDRCKVSMAKPKETVQGTSMTPSGGLRSWYLLGRNQISRCTKIPRARCALELTKYEPKT